MTLALAIYAAIAGTLAVGLELAKLIRYAQARRRVEVTYFGLGAPPDVPTLDDDRCF